MLAYLGRWRQPRHPLRTHLCAGSFSTRANTKRACKLSPTHPSCICPLGLPASPPTHISHTALAIWAQTRTKKTCAEIVHTPTCFRLPSLWPQVNECKWHFACLDHECVRLLHQYWPTWCLSDDFVQHWWLKLDWLSLVLSHVGWNMRPAFGSEPRLRWLLLWVNWGLQQVRLGATPDHSSAKPCTKRSCWTVGLDWSTQFSQFSAVFCSFLPPILWRFVTFWGPPSLAASILRSWRKCSSCGACLGHIVTFVTRSRWSSMSFFPPYIGPSFPWENLKNPHMWTHVNTLKLKWYCGYRFSLSIYFIYVSISFNPWCTSEALGALGFLGALAGLEIFASCPPG